MDKSPTPGDWGTEGTKHTLSIRLLKLSSMSNSVILASELELIVVKKTFLSPQAVFAYPPSSGGICKKNFALTRELCVPQFQIRGAALGAHECEQQGSL